MSSKEEEDHQSAAATNILMNRVESRATTMAANHFLNTILSQRGASSLPYEEQVKWLIRQHLLSLCAEFPSLHPHTSPFTHNDGRSLILLRAQGTIPITFHGLTYNLPILIWLLESYPHAPPSVFLNPTTDMIIKRPHSMVNPSGLVSSPLLINWVYPTSNLVDLVRSLCRFFAIDPPLYSRPCSSNPGSSFSDFGSNSVEAGVRTQSFDFVKQGSSSSAGLSADSGSDYGGLIRNRHSANPSSSFSAMNSGDYGLLIPNRPSANPSSSFSAENSVDYGLLISNRPSANPSSSFSDRNSDDYKLSIQNLPSENPNFSSSSKVNSDDYMLPINSRPSSNPGSSFHRISNDLNVGLGRNEGEEVYRRNVIGKLVERLGADLVDLRKGKEGEIEGVFELQVSLRERDDELRRGLKEMIEEKEGLEQQLQMILMNSDVLEGWVKENEVKIGESMNLNVVNSFEPFDVISKQMLECTCSDLAIEDVIYALDKAAQEGCMKFDQYLKNVRLLSREQFFHRAMASKIRSVAVHAHVSRMAARASSPHVL